MGDLVLPWERSQHFPRWEAEIRPIRWRCWVRDGARLQWVVLDDSGFVDAGVIRQKRDESREAMLIRAQHLAEARCGQALKRVKVIAALMEKANG